MLAAAGPIWEKRKTLLLFTGLEMVWGIWSVWVCLSPLPCTSGNSSSSGCRTRESHFLGVFRTCGHFLCILIILIYSLRLFIEKLPKHRDYKSTVIPEKKDTVKVGLHFHRFPSKSFNAAHTNFKVKVIVSISEHQILQKEMRPFHLISMNNRYGTVGGILNHFQKRCFCKFDLRLLFYFSI